MIFQGCIYIWIVWTTARGTLLLAEKMLWYPNTLFLEFIQILNASLEFWLTYNF